MIRYPDELLRMERGQMQEGEKTTDTGLCRSDFGKFDIRERAAEVGCTAM